MKIQNAYGTKSRQEKELAKTNREMNKHFEDTFDTEDVLLNGIPVKLMIIKDTDGNTYKKKIKAPHDVKFNLGDYVVWNNQHWLITLIDSDEKTWNRGYMYLCTVNLHWQNPDGEIVSRWGYSEDFTKYSTGITGDEVIRYGENQYGIILPTDYETKQLKRNSRYVVDFEDIDEPDVYMLTNRKPMLSNNIYFGRGGTITFTFSLTTFNPDTDKRITLPNGEKVWICNYNSPIKSDYLPNHSSDILAEISGNEKLKIGYQRTYEVVFKDSDGNELSDISYDWNVVADYYVSKIAEGNKIQLYVEDEAFIGTNILLQVIVENKVLSQKIISISEAF